MNHVLGIQPCGTINSSLVSLGIKYDTNTNKIRFELRGAGFSCDNYDNYDRYGYYTGWDDCVGFKVKLPKSSNISYTLKRTVKIEEEVDD